MCKYIRMIIKMENYARYFKKDKMGQEAMCKIVSAFGY